MRYMIVAAVVLMGLGVILIYASVMGAKLIIPGAAIIGAGILLVAVAAILPDRTRRVSTPQADTAHE